MIQNLKYDGKKCRIKDIEMNVVIEGQGPGVLKAHGFPDAITVWHNQQ